MTVNQRQQNVSCSSGEILNKKNVIIVWILKLLLLVSKTTILDTKLYDPLAVNKNS